MSFRQNVAYFRPEVRAPRNRVEICPTLVVLVHSSLGVDTAVVSVVVAVMVVVAIVVAIVVVVVVGLELQTPTLFIKNWIRDLKKFSKKNLKRKRFCCCNFLNQVHKQPK